ncbi:methyltransferase family protein [Chloroflexota bacterium]
MLKLIIFAIVSSGIVLLSWKSMLNRRSHGFFRFFAFESILVLFLLNVEYWFRDPFSVSQVISWFLLVSSIILAVQGFYLLHEIGKPKYVIEDTTVLVNRGIYKYIRHPLYGSLLLLGWGIFFKNPSFLPGGLVLVATASLIATAIVEEAENVQKFGADYAAYMKTTKRLIPFLF